MGHNCLELGSVARLDDVELMAGLHGLVSQDRALTARLLLHLGEVDARGLYRERAFSSMFEYAVEALRMSPDEAYVRLRAAKLGREFPAVLQLLERNELHLSAIKLLAPHLTQANHAELLERARCRSKREVELILAELAPKPDVASVLRKLPAARASAPDVATVVPGAASAACATAVAAVQPGARDFRLESSAQVTTPLSPGRYKVQFTATQALHDKLQQLKDLMRHKIPDGELSAIIERAADLLIEQQLKQRFAQTQKKSPAVTRAVEASQAASRYVPRVVVREVYVRDGGQCAFVSAEGRRCLARGKLELHHVVPHACGGANAVENLKLACRAPEGSPRFMSAMLLHRSLARRPMSVGSSRRSKPEKVGQLLRGVRALPTRELGDGVPYWPDSPNAIQHARQPCRRAPRADA
jgi:hypothetical protein